MFGWIRKTPSSPLRTECRSQQRRASLLRRRLSGDHILDPGSVRHSWAGNYIPRSFNPWPYEAVPRLRVHSTGSALPLPTDSLASRVTVTATPTPLPAAASLLRHRPLREGIYDPRRHSWSRIHGGVRGHPPPCPPALPGAASHFARYLEISCHTRKSLPSIDPGGHPHLTLL